MKNVLIVDSDMVALQTLAGLVQSQSGLINVLSANSRQAALEIMSKHSIHMVITGIQLPEADGIKLVAQLGRAHPKVRVIAMTHNASPMFRAEIKQTPSAVNFDQVLDIRMLPQRIFTELNIKYGGGIRGVSLPSFLQMMELEKCTCNLLVRAKLRNGRITIKRGAPHSAETHDLTGNEAMLEMLIWEHVVIDINYTTSHEQGDVTEPLISLIMESGRKIDEQHIQGQDQREHQRNNCLVAVDYDISDWTYQCFLRDISDGGAYIETSQLLKLNQKITLTLTSPSRNHSCSIQCNVVRRDDKGIGVRFEELSSEQKRVIEDLSTCYCKA